MIQGRLFRHLLASIGTFLAGFGVLLTMGHIELDALIRTGLAYIGTQCADFIGVCAAACHHLARKVACVCAIPTELNTSDP